MRNQLQTYLLPADESALSQRLRADSPTIFLVDHDEAPANNVVVYNELNACVSGFAYIWEVETDDASRALSTWNEGVRRKSGAGPLMQFLRSRIKTVELVTGEAVSLLISGRVAMMERGTVEEKDMRNRVYEVLSSIATPNVYPVDPTTREPIGLKQAGSRVGFHAAHWCSDSKHLLRHVGNPLFLLPEITDVRN